MVIPHYPRELVRHERLSVRPGRNLDKSLREGIGRFRGFTGDGCGKRSQIQRSQKTTTREGNIGMKKGEKCNRRTGFENRMRSWPPRMEAKGSGDRSSS